jgi:hypothetical protein
VIAGGGLLLAVTTADAQELFKWIAQDGSVHYSEILPESGVVRSESLELVPGPMPANAPDEDYRRILEVANRLQADRLARERLRLEQRKLRLEERQARQPDRHETGESRYIPLYRPRYGSPPHYPWYRGHPHGGQHGRVPREAGTPTRRVYPFGYGR